MGNPTILPPKMAPFFAATDILLAAQPRAMDNWPVPPEEKKTSAQGERSW